MGKEASALERIFVVGLNHLGAPVYCREKAAVAQSALAGELAALREAAGLEEIVILSTCSRVEIVGVCGDPAGTAEAAGIARAWFLERTGKAAESALYTRVGREAIAHVFRVAAGLDSWIIGESEILGQVRQAYQSALSTGFTRRALNRLFQSALASGKDVRARTGIQGGIHSIGGAAALIARRIFVEGDGSVLVFGSGQAAEAVARHLAAKNFSRVLVASRTLERAQAVARPLGAEAVAFEEGLALLAEVEIAVFSTSCREPLMDAERLRPLLKSRRRPLFLVDLGLPRNVDPDCAGLDGVYLRDLDDLKVVIQDNMERKSAEKAEAEALAAEHAAECCGQLLRAEALRRVVPVPAEAP